ncbi:MAG: TPM domain-containing protein [Burkholderiales bacterium]|nr:TPM domain-containing protein [Burkholderiales bacterium]
MSWLRVLRHLFFPPWWVRVRFPRRVLDAIEQAIQTSERQHRGQIRFAIEASLALPLLLKGVSPRKRAEEVFALLRVWDTEENNGVLIYVLLADRDVEIVADRGIAAKVEPLQWETICRQMEQAFARGDFEGGALVAIRAVGEHLVRHFPAQAGTANTLSDRPVVL